ncbi:MAG: hypothetical protein A2Z31_00040 [candidate division NC10 bacterium RBG_16_65_8]|nr:MAG: hypothetical protein A2Z31_00040 [candidate division NC10 bacterium RBG_16_65_8]
MTAQALLEQLERNGLKVAARGDKLLVAPRGGLTPEVRNLLRQWKAEILALLQKPVAAPTEILPTLRDEEALYRLWWKTLPDKKLAREHDGHLAYWCRERGLSAESLDSLRGRVRDLLEGNEK